MAGGCLAWTWLWLMTLTCANAGLATSFMLEIKSMYCLLVCILGLGCLLLHDSLAFTHAPVFRLGNSCLSIVLE